MTVPMVVFIMYILQRIKQKTHGITPLNLPFNPLNRASILPTWLPVSGQAVVSKLFYSFAKHGSHIIHAGLGDYDGCT